MTLYIWWCLEMLHTFLEYFTLYRALYVTETKHKQCSFEQRLGENGPSAYQVYITKDYNSTMHIDQNITEFTLCY